MIPLDPVQIQMSLVQGLREKPNSKKLERFAKQIVEKNVSPSFESLRCYQEFLTLLKERQSAFSDSTLYPKVLSIFKTTMGWPEQISEPNVRLVGNEGTSCSIPKELLEFHFKYFRTLFSSEFIESQAVNGIYLSLIHI